MLTLLTSSNLIYAAVTYAAILAVFTICHNTKYQYAVAYCRSHISNGR